MSGPERQFIEASGVTAVWVRETAEGPETWYASSPGRPTLTARKDGKFWTWAVVNGNASDERFATRTGTMRAAMEATWIERPRA